MELRSLPFTIKRKVTNESDERHLDLDQTIEKTTHCNNLVG